MVGLDAIPTLRPVARGCADCLPLPEPLPSKPFFLTDSSTSRRMCVCFQVCTPHGEKRGGSAPHVGRGGAYFSLPSFSVFGARVPFCRGVATIGGLFEVESDL